MALSFTEAMHCLATETLPSLSSTHRSHGARDAGLSACLVGNRHSMTYSVTLTSDGKRRKEEHVPTEGSCGYCNTRHSTRQRVNICPCDTVDVVYAGKLP